MTHHTIVLDTANADRAHYGITFTGRNVFSGLRQYGAPTRVVVWDNTGRINERNGEPVQYGNYGPINGGNGKYLDPQNKATDEAVSILLEPESSVITNSGTNTGTVASGQVYAEGILRDEDTATLIYPDGTTQAVTLHFPRGHNGHGYAA